MSSALKSSETASSWTREDLAADPHRAEDKPERVQRMFASIARRYDLNNRLHSFGRDQSWRRRTVELCRVKPTDRVLDLACGTGDLTLAFAQAHPASVTGLDFTPQMLDIAQVKSERFLRKHPKAVKPEFMRGDAMDLPFESGQFDVVSIAFGLRNLSDPRKGIDEFRRVLRPGGRVAILEFHEPPHSVIRTFNRFYTTRIMPITATLIARDRSGAYRYLPRSVETFSSRDELRAMLKEVGFRDITTKNLTCGVCAIHLAIVDSQA